MCPYTEAATGLVWMQRFFYHIWHLTIVPSSYWPQAFTCTAVSRGRIDGVWSDHVNNQVLMLELPKCAYTKDHLDEIARVISSVYAIKEEITGLKLTNEPHYVDEAEFETHRQPPVRSGEYIWTRRYKLTHYEKYKIAIFEPLKTTDKEFRKRTD